MPLAKVRAVGSHQSVGLLHRSLSRLKNCKATRDMLDNLSTRAWAPLRRRRGRESRRSGRRRGGVQWRAQQWLRLSRSRGKVRALIGLRPRSVSPCALASCTRP